MVSLTIGKYVFESFITQRQHQVLGRPVPPPVLARRLDEDTFQKTQAYGLAKAKFRQASELY
jgi:STE24 endopeptidase